MVNDSISWKIYVMAGIITIVVFSLGVGIGYLISNEKYDIMFYDFENLRIQQRDIETELLLINSLGTQSCGTLKYEIEKTAVQSAELGEKVSLYDKEIIKSVCIAGKQCPAVRIFFDNNVHQIGMPPLTKHQLPIPGQ